MQYVYLKGGGGDPFTVGFYDPKGDWRPESDHDSPEEAAKRVRFLNGGEVVPDANAVALAILAKYDLTPVPPTGMTVAQAVQLMRHEDFEGHRAIGIDISIHSEAIEIQFNVYDGREHFYGATLEGAVQSCLVSNNVFSGSQDEADRIIREAMEYKERL